MSAPSLETTNRDEPSDELDTALEIFLAQRTMLFRIARRVTGDLSSAEEVVQEAWLRWQRTDRSCIKNPAAFLTTTTTHLAINVIQSARHRHEAPSESPLLESGHPTEDPTLRAERTAAVEQAMHAMMARLTPAELAAYLLRKGFDYPYDEIAGLLHTSTVNVRQLVRRAQQHVEGDRERAVDGAEHRVLVDAFLVGARTGELEDLERVVSERAVPTVRTHGRRPDRTRTDRVSRLAPGSPWNETIRRREDCSAGGASARPSTT